MAQLGYQYSIAIGSNVALASLINVEDLLYGTTAPRRIVPRSQPVNAFPQRVLLGSGRERGDGTINHQWEFTALPVAAVNYLNTYLFSSGTVVSTAVTIYTRRHELGTYARYNANATLPLPGQDMEYLRQGIVRLVLRFTDLVAL